MGPHLEEKSDYKGLKYRQNGTGRGNIGMMFLPSYSLSYLNASDERSIIVYIIRAERITN